MSRHEFDGDKLADDIARLAAEDNDSPPSALPSLMDVVRELAPFIATRTRLNWGDAKIAAVLSEAGYPIDAATLRSYRKRLRDEGLLPPLTGGARKQKASAPAERPAGVTPVPPKEISPPIKPPVAAEASTPVAAALNTPAQSAPALSNNRPSFRVDRDGMPPDRA